ncbi:MAG: amidohydrolase, partial [Myxococcales bacterium]|nr:amidohydrolase [Myxococcales bacterium]
GLAAVFAAPRPGPTVIVRAELDAVPVERAEQDPQALAPPTFEHRCGHDAHMTMVAGLAPLLSVRRPDAGRVVLLFQPAEETGQGAKGVLEDPQFENLRPDFAVALHNLPGVSKNTVVLREDVFACASVGMLLELHGEPAHAAEPEKGVSPAAALGALLATLPTLSTSEGPGYRLVTITHADMGRRSFGVSPGHAELFATLRAHTTEDLDAVRARVAELVQTTATQHGLRAQLAWHEAFPETRSDARLVRLLRTVCTELQVNHVERPQPMRWSDDFGHVAAAVPAVYFGLGIGEDRPGLHQEGYAFPDDVLPVGLEVLYRFVTRLLAIHG